MKSPSIKLRQLFAIASVVLLAGCQSMGMGVDPSKITAVSSLPTPAEREWPDQKQDVLNQRARVELGLIRSPELENYLNGLYAKIKKQAGVPNWQGKVYIVANSNLTAYATAAGNIYISPSWISTAQSEDEIVAIMSHEFGHVYLHYHELEKTKVTADQAADWITLGAAIAQNTNALNGWPVADLFATGYGASRDIAVGHYGSSQELAADKFALNLSTKMGYSYEAGVKAYLEHQATWEDQNEARQKAYEDKLSESLTGLGTLASLKIAQGWKFVTSDHPKTIDRMDAVAIASDDVPPKLLGKKPVVKPFNAVRNSGSVNSMLKSFGYAMKGLENPNAPDAFDQAKKSATGANGKYAYAALAVFKTQLASALNGNASSAVGIGRNLDTNINSEPDRAWKVYVTKADFLARLGHVPLAKSTMDQGFAYFSAAGEAWPEAILFYGQYESWDKAKKMAATCAKEFPGLAKACKTAAITPAEKAEMDRRAQENANRLVNKLMKKDK